MAMARRSPRITTQIVSVKEFPELTSQYEVTLLPKLWVNDRIYMDGAAPDRQMMEKAMVLMMKQSFDPSIEKGSKLAWPKD
jgi:hypothetical protein